jgi:hypothetical protein
MTKKVKGRILFWVAASAVALSPSLSRAFTIRGEGDESLKFAGYVENWTGIGTFHGDLHMPSDGKVIMFRNTFLPEFTWTLGQGTTLFASARFVKDGPYAWENRLRREPRFSRGNPGTTPGNLTPPFGGPPSACSKVVVKELPPPGPAGNVPTTDPGGPCTGPLPDNFYDQTDFNAFELVLDQKPSDRLSLRLGKQFIVWGESDVFRMLDLVNPQDSSFAPPSLMPLEETRSPIWAARVLYTLPPGRDTVLEAFFAPGFDEVTKVTIPGVDPTGAPTSTLNKFTARTDFGLAPGTGRFSIHPETRMNNVLAMFTPTSPGPRTSCTLVPGSPPGVPPCSAIGGPLTGNFVIPSIVSVDPKANIADGYRLGVRGFRTMGRFTVGLGYIYTFNPISGERTARFNGVKTRPLTRLDVNPCIIKNTSAPCAGPGNGPNPALNTLKLQDTDFIDINLVPDRTSIFAMYFNTVWDAIDTAIRGEFSFWPNKPYNIGKFNDGRLPDARVAIKPSVKHPSQVTKKHTIKYAIGFDRPTFIPALHPDDPFRAFGISLQLFQNILVDSVSEGSGKDKERLRQFFHATKIDKVSTTLTARIDTGYINNTYLPTLTLAYDPNGYGLVNFDLGYTPPWNEKIRLDWVVLQFMGRNKFDSLGLFDEKDGIFFRFRYQF